MTRTIRKGDPIRIKPEWQDDGDGELEWIAVDDEEKGRVSIMATNTGLTYPPVNTVRADMVDLITERTA